MIYRKLIEKLVYVCIWYDMLHQLDMKHGWLSVWPILFHVIWFWLWSCITCLCLAIQWLTLILVCSIFSIFNVFLIFILFDTAPVIYRIHIWLIFDIVFDDALNDQSTVAWFTFTMSITAAVSGRLFLNISHLISDSLLCEKKRKELTYWLSATFPKQ